MKMMACRYCTDFLCGNGAGIKAVAQHNDDENQNAIVVHTTRSRDPIWRCLCPMFSVSALKHGNRTVFSKTCKVIIPI